MGPCPVVRAGCRGKVPMCPVHRLRVGGSDRESGCWEGEKSVQVEGSEWKLERGRCVHSGKQGLECLTRGEGPRGEGVPWAPCWEPGMCSQTFRILSRGAASALPKVAPAFGRWVVMGREEAETRRVELLQQQRPGAWTCSKSEGFQFSFKGQIVSLPDVAGRSFLCFICSVELCLCSRKAAAGPSRGSLTWGRDREPGPLLPDQQGQGRRLGPVSTHQQGPGFDFRWWLPALC